MLYSFRRLARCVSRVNIATTPKSNRWLVRYKHDGPFKLSNTQQQVLSEVIEACKVGKIDGVVAEGRIKVVEDLIKDPTLDNRLRLALLLGEDPEEKVSELVLQGANPNITAIGLPLLTLAVMTENKDMVSTLLQTGKIEIDAVDADNLTALFRAARRKNDEIMDLLVQHKANVDCVIEGVGSLLTAATKLEDLPLMEKLLRLGADVNLRISNRIVSPILAAATNRNVEVLRFLVKHGAKVDGVVEGHALCLTPLMAAIQNGDPNMAHALLDLNANVWRRDQDGRTALFYAALYNQEEIGLRLVHNMSNVLAKDEHNTTPLHVAAEKGLSRLVTALLQSPVAVDVNAVSDEYTNLYKAKDTPLERAKRNNHSDIVAKLLAAGATEKLGKRPDFADVQQKLYNRLEEAEQETKRMVDIQQVFRTQMDQFLQSGPQDIFKNIPKSDQMLFMAVMKGDARLVSELVQQGANPNIVVQGTPLLVATIIFGKLDITRVLVHTGKVEIDAVDPFHHTALVKALFLDKHSIMDFLIKHGANVDFPLPGIGSPLIFALKGRDMKKITKLIELGANVNFKPPSRIVYPLNIAVAKKHIEAVRLLVRQGAKVDGVDDPSTFTPTPLMLACHRGDIDTVRALLDLGADVYRRDVEYSTALHYAIREGHEEVGLLLVSRGSDVRAQTQNGITPLLLAAEKGLTRLVEVLARKLLE